MSSGPNVNVRNLKGENGGVHVTDNTPAIGNFDAIQALADSVTALVSTSLIGDLSAVNIPKGSIIFGRFTSVTMASGELIAYNAAP